MRVERQPITPPGLNRPESRPGAGELPGAQQELQRPDGLGAGARRRLQAASEVARPDELGTGARRRAQAAGGEELGVEARRRAQAAGGEELGTGARRRAQAAAEGLGPGARRRAEAAAEGSEALGTAARRRVQSVGGPGALAGVRPVERPGEAARPETRPLEQGAATRRGSDEIQLSREALERLGQEGNLEELQRPGPDQAVDRPGRR